MRGTTRDSTEDDLSYIEGITRTKDGPDIR